MKRTLIAITIYILAATIGVGIANLQNNKITSLTNEGQSDIIQNIDIESLQAEVREISQETKPVVNTMITEEVAEVQEETIPKYDIPLDKELQQYIYDKCKEFNFSYELAIAVIKIESNFKVDAINKNSNGSRDSGLFQINSIHRETFKDQGFTDMLDPYQNIAYGISMLSDLYHRYDDEHRVLMAYNFGVAGAKRVVSRGITSSKYSRKVMDYKDELD